MATERWPIDLLMPQNVAWDIAPRTLAAPSAVSGITQVVATDAGIWKATYDTVAISRRDQILAFRALGVRLEGRLNPVLLPLCRAWQPRLDDSDGTLFNQVPHSDEALFDDDTGYVIADQNDIYLVGSLPARATVANVFVANGGPIEPGQHFSIGERLYRIASVTYTTDNSATITFRPPLREAVAGNIKLEFDDPVCRMRLATDDAMDLELALHRFGSPTILFLEAV